MSTLLRRILHATLFEIGGLAILVPAGSWLLGYDGLQFGSLALLLTLTAMVCNMIYNHGFEWFERRHGWQRTLKVRIAHSSGFELFLTLVTVPLTAWWMSMGWLDALLLDLGLTLFYLVYGFCFNWLYDWSRRKLAR